MVDSPNPISNSKNDKASSPTKQYLMQSYYDRYTSLHDSDFENFMSQEVTSGLCEALPENHNSMLRLSVVRRDLVGEGSHRRMSTLIKLQSQQLKSLSELLSYSCEFIVIERLPSGVFADPFELQHLAQRGGKYAEPAFQIINKIESGIEVSCFYIKEHLHISYNQ